MSDQTTPIAFVVALKDQLIDRFAAISELSEVQVFLMAPGEDRSLTDTVVLIGDIIESTQDYVHPNRSRDEDVSIPGFLVTYSADPDGDDAAVLAAAERAKAIVEVILDEVKDNAPLTANQARMPIVTDLGWDPYTHPNGGIGCMLKFSIQYTVRVF